MNISLLFIFLVLKCDKHLYLALMAWVLLSGCVCESVGMVQEARDHSYFHTRSVVDKVYPNLGSVCVGVPENLEQEKSKGSGLLTTRI